MKTIPVLWFLFLIIVAIGFGLYVYPHSPALVWGTLGLCWVCYRLRLRAIKLFGDPNKKAPVPTGDEEDEDYTSSNHRTA